MRADRPNAPLVLVVPFPSQGHVNPLVQFGKRLSSQHGIRFSLVTTPYIQKSILESSPQNQTSTTHDHLHTSTPIHIELISDGFDESGFAQSGGDEEAYLQIFKSVGSRTLGDLMERLAASGHCVNCIVYDSFLPWVLDVAKAYHVPGAAFFTFSALGCTSYYYWMNKQIVVSPETIKDSGIVDFPGFGSINVEDLPSFITAPESIPGYTKVLISQFSNINDADAILINTVFELEADVLQAAAQSLRFKPIGPTIPSAYLIDDGTDDDDNYNMIKDTNYNSNFWKYSSRTEKLFSWLDDKPAGSVIYASFGSMSRVNEVLVSAVKAGLEATKRDYILVVMSSSDPVLDHKEALFSTNHDHDHDHNHKKGVVLSWCPQVEVLAHAAVGCFLTHSGWNSTLEGLSLGVPMVCLPLWADQTTDAMLVQDVWKVGLRPKVGDDGVVSAEEIERCVREVMGGGEKGMEIRENVKKWSGVMKKSVGKGGSSDKNVREFIDEVLLRK